MEDPNVTDVLPTSTEEWDERQDEIRRAKEAVAGPVPLIGEAPNCHITLPRGVFARENWQRAVELRELTGTDEELMSKMREAGEIFDTLIACGVVRIGELDLASMPMSERKMYLGRLLLGERDQLFLAIIRATYGDSKTLVFTCGNCDTSQDLVLDLTEDFKTRDVENVTDESFVFTTSKGERLDVRPATGADQQEVLGRKGASNAEQNTIVLSRCITAVNGGIVVDPMAYARGMSMRDRQALLDQLVNRQPGIDLSVSVTCVECQEEQRFALSWGDLFRL
jgi:hypothetical protein